MKVTEVRDLAVDDLRQREKELDKTVKVAIERQVRDPLYGKIQRRTSTFLAHDEKNEAKTGDRVAITETRPMSRRKRWAVTSNVETAKEI